MKRVLRILKSAMLNFRIGGVYVKRYRPIYIILMLIISVFELSMMIRGLIILDFSNIKHVLYFTSYVFLLVVSLSASIFLIFFKKKQTPIRLSIVLNVYSFFIIMWSTLISVLDMMDGMDYPIVFLTIIGTLGGIIVINPIIYLSAMTISTITLITIGNSLGNYNTFGLFFNFFVFLVMAIIVSIRNYIISINEEKAKEQLRTLSRHDVLTGLGNETAYFMEIDKIAEELKKDNTLSFIVLVLDVNGLKAVDDKYGHRYGSHLIKTAGNRLHDIFPEDCCFHVGGDEFVIIKKEKLSNFDNQMKELENRLTYSKIIFEGKELILSLAYGYTYHQKGELYSETFQRADERMFASKIVIKEKYHIESRKDE